MIKIVPVIALAAFVLTPVCAASAADTTAKSANATVQDFSAAKKKKSKTKVQVNPDGYTYYTRPPSGWRGMDPVYPPNPEIAWRRSIGQCVIDLGYGRWESCDGPSYP